MNKLAHFTNVYVSMDMTKPEYQIWVDRERAAELGVSMTDVATTVKSLVSGAVASRYRDGDYYYNIRVVIPEKEVGSKQDIENLSFGVYTGRWISKGKRLSRGQPFCGAGRNSSRQDQVKAVTVRGDASGVSVGEALTELKESISKMDRPVGYDFSYGGQALLMAEMSAHHS